MDATITCKFCDIIKSRPTDKIGYMNNSVSTWNTILYETPNFVVIPALGSLVPGYVMIVSKDHVYSMAYLHTSKLDELISICNYLKCFIYKKYNIYPIIFEHGAALGCSNKSGCCIEHAHWHVVPVQLSREKAMLKCVNATEIDDLRSICSYCGKPYLLYSSQNGSSYLSCGVFLPSQYMRQWIAKEIGCPDKWDWRYNSFSENIQNTVSAFS